MRLVCPNCSTQYEVDADLIPEDGREVQCASCAHSWFQERVTDPEGEDAPLTLNTPAAGTPEAESEETADKTSAPVAEEDDDPGLGVVASPAETDEEDRARLRAAVEEELAIQEHDLSGDTNGGAGTDDTADQIAAAIRDTYEEEQESKTDEEPETAKTASVETAETDATSDTAPDEDEEELLKNLRSQLAGVDKEFKGVEPASSRRRSVAVAAASAGIDTGGLTVAEAAQEARKADPRKVSSSLSDDDDPYAEFRRPRSRARAGFVTILILGAIGAGVYFFRGQIAGAYPPAEPYLTSYASAVDGARAGVESLYVWARDLMATDTTGGAG